MKPLSVSQMKNVEKNAVEQGVSYIQLMENAGVESARKITQKYYVLNKNVVILCGNGNNGGDGYVIARKLYERGANVTLVPCMGEPKTPESVQMHANLPDKAIEMTDLENDLPIIFYKIREADFIVDAVFGTGFHGIITGVCEQLILRANQSAAVRISIDIPSGMSGDEGIIEGTYFHPACTLVLGAQKKAHALAHSAPLCGEQELLEIGIPEEAFDGLDLESCDIQYAMARMLLPKRKVDANKGDFGRLLLIAGSAGMGGAAMMCTQAALRSGAGLTILAAAKSVTQAVFPHMMEAMTLPLEETPDGAVSDRNLDILQKALEHATAVVIGCGLGTHEETKRLVRALLKTARCPIVLDADGINAIVNDIDIVQTAKCPIILTPHPGEMARLTGLSIPQIQAKREKTAYDFATSQKVILVLKGHETLVATPNGTLFRNTTGNPGMAKGGSGDVLAGMLGAFLTQGIKPDKAAILSVYLHGLAGDRCAEQLSQYGMVAGDLIRELPLLLNELQPGEPAFRPSAELEPDPTDEIPNETAMANSAADSVQEEPEFDQDDFLVRF